jgi:hypothetical protein
MNILEQNKYIDKISEELRSVVKRHYHRIQLTSWGSSGLDFHIDLPKKFASYKEGEYYYQDELRFVQWTSIEALTNIINTREIRLYNLVNSKDEDEF